MIPRHGSTPRENSDVHYRSRLVVLLAMVSGATDALGYFALGGVFASVMTGNMVLFGVTISTHDGAMLAHISIAIISYITGCALGTAVAGAPQSGDGTWPTGVTRALIAELVLFLGLSVLWWCADGQPGTSLQPVLLALAALALGVQSCAITRFGVSGMSSTYLTGTLTTVIHNLVLRRHLVNVRLSVEILIGLIAGAALCTLLVQYTPIAAPMLMLVALISVLVLSRLRWRTTRFAEPASD